MLLQTLPAALLLWGLAQSARVPLFTDATSANLPADANLHSLDTEVGDFDKDGDLDMGIAVEGGVNLLYINNGAGKFTKTTPFSAKAADGEDLRVVDFDHDGNLDVVFVTEDDQVHQFYLGNGNGTFRDMSARISWRCAGNGVEAGDVNGDTWQDVIIGCTDKEILLINDKKGGWLNESSTRLPAMGESTQDIKMGDLDGDGDLDLVFGNENMKNRLLFNNGSGVFTDGGAGLPIPYAEETREVLLVDVDNDKDLDMVFCNITCNNCGQFVKNPQTRLLINDGKGKFTDETAARMPKNTFSAWDGGTLDFDADGDQDLIICAIAVGLSPAQPEFNPMAWRAYRNDGKGFFTDATAEVMPAGSTGRGWDVEAADLNKDGALDVFLGCWGTQARLFLGTVKQPSGLRPAGKLPRRHGSRLLLSAPGWAFAPKVEGRFGLLDFQGRFLAPEAVFTIPLR